MRYTIRLLCAFLVFTGAVAAQQIEEEDIQPKTKSPRAVDFSRILEQEKLPRGEWEKLRRQKALEYQETLTRLEAIEKAVDPDEYVVGPGDLFSFNVWGAAEVQIPVSVSPEGNVAIPYLGEIKVSGLTLSRVQEQVKEKARNSYGASDISFSLQALRFFRVYVTGEVNYPGSFPAQAVDRISDLIIEAGGITELAWKQGVELRREGNDPLRFDLAQFEQKGNLDQNRFVQGGDMIYIPPVNMAEHIIRVEGSTEVGGRYQIIPGQNLLNFLQDNRLLKRETKISAIRIVRPASGTEGEKVFAPFQKAIPDRPSFTLLGGDRVIIPVQYVYVKGAVQSPGAFPFVSNMKARDYAGMAGGDFRSGHIKSIRVFHSRSGITEKGPDAPVEPGDIVHLNPSWGVRFEPYIRLIPTITSLILAAKAAGFLGN